MPELSRREFAEALAIAALVPVIGPIVGPTAGALPWGGGASAVPAPSAALAKALAAVIRVQYGNRLSASDLAVVTRQIEAGLERAEKIRKVPLTNGDEPDIVFSAAGVRGME